jgi:hypothetical protein
MGRDVLARASPSTPRHQRDGLRCTPEALDRETVNSWHSIESGGRGGSADDDADPDHRRRNPSAADRPQGLVAWLMMSGSGAPSWGSACVL